MIIGLFAETSVEERPSPLAPSKGKVRLDSPDIQPHVIWCKFIHERVEIARYCSQHEIDVFVAMFNQCLGTVIGSKRRQRTIRYGSCLFRFLTSALRLLQDDNSQNVPAKNALRERIYATAMDYFAGPLDFPLDFKLELREDIKVLIRFWVLLHTDKRYLHAEAQDSFDGRFYELQSLHYFKLLLLLGICSRQFGKTKHVKRQHLDCKSFGMDEHTAVYFSD